MEEQEGESSKNKEISEDDKSRRDINDRKREEGAKKKKGAEKKSDRKFNITCMMCRLKQVIWRINMTKLYQKNKDKSRDRINSHASKRSGVSEAIRKKSSKYYTGSNEERTEKGT